MKGKEDYINGPAYIDSWEVVLRSPTSRIGVRTTSKLASLGIAVYLAAEVYSMARSTR